MNPVTIVVLGRFPDIFNGFKESADRYLPDVPKIFVRDKELITAPQGDKWTTIQGPEVFSNPGNANLGWQAADENSDILYVGDDVRFQQNDTIKLLQEAAYSDPAVGIVSPKVVGAAGNELQIHPNPEGLTYSNQRLAFICVLIKREVIDEVGYMDPVYGGSYGWDDDDYCYRVQLVGYRLAVTASASIVHQHAASTFTRTGPGADCRDGEQKFRTKWGNDAMAQIAAGVRLDTVRIPNTQEAVGNIRTFRRLGRR